MNNRFRFCIAFYILSSFFFSSKSYSQEYKRWNKDSILSVLNRIFPNTAGIIIPDTFEISKEDSLMPQPLIKAEIHEKGKNNPVYFYFYQPDRDTSLLRSLLEAAMKTAFKTMPDNYMVSFPFIDSSGTRLLIYRIPDDQGDGYSDTLDAKIIGNFQVRDPDLTFKLVDVKVEPDPNRQPSPPLPPPPSRSKSKKEKAKRYNAPSACLVVRPRVC